MVWPVQTDPNDGLSIRPLRILNRHEYEVLQRLRRDAFTPWSDSHPPRFVYNLAAHVFPAFLLAARNTHAEIVRFLFSAPAFWSGEPNELQTYDYHMKSLNRRPLLKMATV